MQAQRSDTLRTRIGDDSLTLIIKPKAKKISEPTRAALYSAALPGLGQYYNKKLWYIKVPVIYGGATALAITMSLNHKQYVAHRNAYLYRLDGNPLTEPSPIFSGATDDGLRSRRDRFRRERDYTMILSLGFYLLNIAEAATTAHLKGFDVSDDLSFKVLPSVQPISQSGQVATGLALRLSFKSPQEKVR